MDEHYHGMDAYEEEKSQLLRQQEKGIDSLHQTLINTKDVYLNVGKQLDDQN
ncbi:MAG: hypothetical protein MHPSP_004075, partial [Paramarteilia canceri]